MAIRFDGRVAIVTGAGAGLGRAHALGLAKLGAKVVVNDMGAKTDGSGGSATPAEAVVEEIRKAGGEAIANGADVSDFAQVKEMVAQAAMKWGSVDLMVANAGILRDKSFGKMEPEDFAKVIAVHLTGTFNCCKAVWDGMRERNYGRIVLTTSSSGLFGNFGQANYAAAKLGIVGLSKSIALDMNRFNVRSNCVSPFAWSRLIGTIPTETDAEKERVKRMQQMGPEKIAPLSVFLLSDAAKDVTGQIFAVRMNEIFLMSQSRPLRSIHRAEGWTPQTIAEHGMPALKSSFYKLDRSADIFSWEAI